MMPYTYHYESKMVFHHPPTTPLPLHPFLPHSSMLDATRIPAFRLLSLIILTLGPHLCRSRSPVRRWTPSRLARS